MSFKRSTIAGFIARANFFFATLLLAVAASWSLEVVAVPLQENRTVNNQAVRRAPSSLPAKRRVGSITGRVVDNAGQPLRQAAVSLRAAGDNFRARPRSTQVDAEGRFRFDNLPAVAYSVSAYSPGYTSERFSDFSETRTYYRITQDITLHMIKGGIITGRVTKIDGEPAVAVPVRASFVRDARGRPPQVTTYPYMMQRHTDDRGIYRLFGLPPGIYIVSVNFNRNDFSSDAVNDEAMPTYHPSATRDTASELTVRESQESSGIDIQMRGERGHTISGKISGAVITQTNMFGGLSVSLVHTGTRTVEAMTYVEDLENGNRSFELDGIPDGEYEIKAQRENYNQAVMMMSSSAARRVAVKGADVSGLDLALAPPGSIEGRVVFERRNSLPGDTPTGNCVRASEAASQETVIRSQRAEKNLVRIAPMFRPAPEGILNEQNEFALRSLESGRYRLDVTPPGDGWYVRAITGPATTRSTARVAARPGAANTAAAAVANPGGLEFNLRPGERLRDTVVTLTEGAASVRGRVAAAQSGVALPSNLLVRLIPSESERADDALRYSHAAMQDNGEFSLTNIAPGRYWLFAESVDGDLQQFAAWDAERRAKLRQVGASANTVIEVQPCKIITDHTLLFPATK